jgi:hypothetical protein
MIAPYKVTRFYVEVPIKSMEIDCTRCDILSCSGGNPNCAHEVKTVICKRFSQKKSAKRWVAKMTYLNEIDYFLLSPKERDAEKESCNLSEFMRNVNAVSLRLFGEKVYGYYYNEQGDKMLL